MQKAVTPLAPATEQLQEQMTASEGYVRRLLVETDVELNVATDGRPDETISTRLAEDDLQGKSKVSRIVGRIGSRILDVFEPDHGAKAAAGDKERAEAELQAIDKAGLGK